MLLRLGNYPSRNEGGYLGDGFVNGIRDAKVTICMASLPFTELPIAFCLNLKCG